MQASASLLRERLASLALPGTVWIGSRPVEPARRLETGIPLLDGLLAGGFPRGYLSEIVGAPSSGRTSLVCALLASATRCGEWTAVVDVADVLHPDSLYWNGVDLSRVLWVRPPTLDAGFGCAELILSSGGFGLLLLDLDVPAGLRAPAKVWLRLARLARQRGTVVAVLAQQRLAGSFAALSVALAARRIEWTPPPWRLFQGMSVRAVVTRSRFGVAGGKTDVWVMRHGS